MLMPGRSYNSAEYRFGFNGKESDDEVSGNANQYDYGFRIYNPRLGKFLSVDPLTYSYPMLTPYQFASNTPIQAIDLDGLEARYVRNIYPDGKTVVNITVDVKVRNLSHASKEEVRNLINEFENTVDVVFYKNDPATNTEYRLKIENVIFDDNADLKKDFVVSVESWGKNYPGYGQTEGGIGNTQNNNIRLNIDNADGLVATHELGHAMGLRHLVDEFNPKEPNLNNADPKSETSVKESPRNVMRTGGVESGYDVTAKQMETTVKTIDKNGGGKTNYVKPKTLPGQSTLSPDN